MFTHECNSSRLYKSFDSRENIARDTRSRESEFLA